MRIRFFLFLSTFIFIFPAKNLAQAQIQVDFSKQRGFYSNSFDLVINASGYDISVKYTLDGSEPTASNGITPININSFTITDINRSTVVRVLVYNAEEKVSKTHTYIFANDVFTQNNNSVINELLYPVEWGYGGNKVGIITCRRQAADYDMTINNCTTSLPNYQQKLIDGLMEIPTMAISLDKSQIFGADSGIYVFPVEESDNCYTIPNNVHSWERKASVEIFNDIQGSDTLNTQVNAGLSISGASTRYFDFYKHSFKLKFRSEYGAGKFKYPLFGDDASDKFESLQLRLVGQSSPHDFSADRRLEPQFHKDSWTKYLQKQLCGYGTSATSKFFHLFINGIYWGMYDVTERPDEDFMEDYYGGVAEDYDVIKVKEVKNGTDSVYNYMYDLGYSIYDSVQIGNFSPKAVVNLSKANSFYNEMNNLLDIDNFIDYSLLNILLVNTDWIENNWWAARNAQNNGKFNFFEWDAEIILNYAGNNRKIYTTGNEGITAKYHPISLNQRLLGVPAYKTKFGDNIQCHCIEDDGVLNPQNLANSYSLFEEKIRNASLLEFLRWGDARKLESNFVETCYDAVEQTAQKYKNDYFPILLKNMLYFYGNQSTFAIFPANYTWSSSAPVEIFNFKAVKFPKLGGEVPNGYQLVLTNPNTKYDSNAQLVPQGDIYYTTDGSDPRNLDGSISSTATKYTNPILIDEYKMIKARIFAASFTYRYNGAKSIDSLWTAMCPREFFPAAYYDDLVINEIHYNPADIGLVSGSNLEFIEIKNISDKELNISNTKFTRGIHYQFPMGAKLQANNYIVLASDSVAAKNYYGITFDGQYNGKLANNGEHIQFSRPDDVEIDALRYNDEPPWSTRPDGGGTSLSLQLSESDKKNNELAKNWASSAEGNTPKAENVFCLPLDLDLTIYQPSCYNGSDGFVSLAVDGGTPPYSIQWSDNSTTNYLQNLASGNYEVEVIDDNNCLETKRITVNNPNPIYSNLQVTHASSANSADGSATINPSNLPNGYSVLWSDGGTANTNTNILPGNNYWVKIIDNRSDACSITESFSVEVAAACTMPFNISATPTSAHSAIVNWSNNSDNTNYTISYSALGDSVWQTVNTTLPSLLLNNLEACTTYEYKVSSSCNFVNSNTSLLKSFITAGCADLCNGGDVNGKTVNITSYSSFILWDIIPNATYKLNYRKNGLSFWNEYETPLNFAILFGLDNCANYDWFVEIICPDGTITANNVNNFTTADCIKIASNTDENNQELANNLEFVLYPNPAQDFINISSKNSEPIEDSDIFIYDFSGKLVKIVGRFNKEITVNIEDLQTGLYVVQIVNNSQNLQYRFKKK